MRLSKQFILYFFMKKLIHANKTLKSTYALKTQSYLYTFYAYHPYMRMKISRRKLFTTSCTNYFFLSIAERNLLIISCTNYLFLSMYLS